MPTPPDSDPSFPSSSAEVWAEVRAGERVMRYRRSGAGGSGGGGGAGARAILLLRSSPELEPLWPELQVALDARFRVITPQAPLHGVDVVGWLTDFLEGLGIIHVALLAADDFRIPALELAQLDADQIARVVLIADGRSDETGEGGLTGSVATTVPRTTVPLLVVHRGLRGDDAMPAVMGFLDDRAAADTSSRP